MKIGLVTTSYPRSETDGAGVFVRGFARTLAALGHDVEVLAPESSTPAELPVDERVQVRPVPYLRPRALQQTFYGAGVPDNVAKQPLVAAGAVPFVAALAYEVKSRGATWDAVVSHWALPCSLVVGRVLPNLPHIAVLHGADVHALHRAPLSTALRRNVATHAHLLWFVSAQLQEKFGDVFGTATMAHAMGVDDVSTSERRPEPAMPRDTPWHVVTLSRLVDIKGIDVAINAVRDDASCTLSIAGDGPLRAELEQLAGSLSHVRFVGWVAGNEKEALLQSADVLLLPSRTTSAGREEGAPTVILEAMLRGIPVIAARTGGVAELIEDGETGLLVPPDDAGAMARAIARMRADETLRAKIVRSAADFAQRFTWSAMRPVLADALETARDRSTARD